MNAIPDGIALGGRPQPAGRRLAVVVAVVFALVSGTVIGRATAAHPSSQPHPTTHALQIIGPDGQNAQTRVRVMKKMNSLLRGSPLPTQRGAR